MNDNRHYVWTDAILDRPEYAHIEHWISPRARVIDLGCGNGLLLKQLKEKKQIAEAGIDVSPSGVELCHMQGVQARVGRIDVALEDLPDRAFDFAICNVTLQMVLYPEMTLCEMKRIAVHQIISFPNFAFVLNRLELLLWGRMPRRMLGGYTWYNTGHLHQFSIRDFRELARESGLVVEDCRYLGKLPLLRRLWPNLFAQTAIFLCRSK